jgi:hypothetical protein
LTGTAVGTEGDVAGRSLASAAQAVSAREAVRKTVRSLIFSPLAGFIMDTPQRSFAFLNSDFWMMLEF